MSIDETAPSKGDLFTFLSNKDGHGRKGSITAAVRGTKSEDIVDVLKRIPEEDRKRVMEVTMDFSDSMYAAVSDSFPNAEIVIDCFHIIQLATSALGEIRMKHKRKAMAKDAKARREHKKRLKYNAERRKKRKQRREQQRKTKSKCGRPQKERSNQAYRPERLSNGDTMVELLTRSRYLISQSREKWTESQKQRANILFSLYPDILSAYNLVNDLRNIFKNKTLTADTASGELEEWYQKIEASRLNTLKSVADTIQSRQEHVVNYFNKRHTNASAESLNSKIKGFRSMLRGVTDLPFFMYRIATVFG